MGVSRRDLAEAIKKSERKLRDITPRYEAAKKAFEELEEAKIDAERDIEWFKRALEEHDRQEGRL
jgi:hypothetical protein